MEVFINVCIDALIITCVLALAAYGLAIIYGLLGVINLGHGAMLTMGAYFFWHATTSGVPFVIAALMAGIVVAFIGLIFEHLVIRHFYDKPFDTMLLTWGFFLLVSECLKLVYGTELRGVPNPLPGAFSIGNISIPIYRSLLAIVTIALLGITAFIFYYTNLGLKIRAVIQNKEMAQMLGMNTDLMYKSTFMIGACMAGISGAILSPLLSIEPYIGNVYLVRSFFVVILGGVGQLIGGTMVGSFIVGGLETVMSLFTSQTIAQIGVFAIAAVIVRFRPSGVFKS